VAATEADPEAPLHNVSVVAGEVVICGRAVTESTEDEEEVADFTPQLPEEVTMQRYLELGPLTELVVVFAGAVYVEAVAPLI
jgi:hypothetical protein